MQRCELQDYCKRRGWDLCQQYVDVGVSGSKDRRPPLFAASGRLHGAVAILIICQSVAEGTLTRWRQEYWDCSETMTS